MSTIYNEHKPVMLEEVLSFVPNAKKITYIDMTLGRGGHAYQILSKLRKGSTFYGVDRDEDALDYSKGYLGCYHEKIDIHYLHSDFSNATDILKKDIPGADFILMDIGVSSPQFDDPSRGFSYRFDAPLDMRMNQEDSLTAKIIVNTYPEKELIRVFKELGECEGYYPVVKNIMKARESKVIETTYELVDIIKSSLPNRLLRKEGHPAKQFFLGLRYEVNGEITQLQNGLKKAINFLKPKGRLVIISFNSEEDRIVKEIFRSYCSNNHKDKYKEEQNSTGYTILTKKPLLPTKEEIEENNRAKASILRALERN
jgi:16S rRNA (cytosine1402-N4)-methyltransferase